MTLTLITETVQALSPDARRALLNYQDAVGALEPMGMTFTVHRELCRVRAVDWLGCLLPFGHMLRAAVLDQELDKMDPPDRGMADPYGDNVRGLVAAAREWRESLDVVPLGAERLMRAIEALS